MAKPPRREAFLCLPTAKPNALLLTVGGILVDKSKKITKHTRILLRFFLIFEGYTDVLITQNTRYKTNTL